LVGAFDGKINIAKGNDTTALTNKNKRRRKIIDNEWKQSSNARKWYGTCILMAKNESLHRGRLRGTRSPAEGGPGLVGVEVVVVLEHADAVRGQGRTMEIGNETRMLDMRS